MSRPPRILSWSRRPTSLARMPSGSSSTLRFAHIEAFSKRQATLDWSHLRPNAALQGHCRAQQGTGMKTAIPDARTLQELRRKVDYGNEAAGMDLPSKWRNALPNPFQKDIIRMIAILFGPMLVGAVLIPLLMIIFSLLGYSY